ncbi:DUF937 domain-containing protein [Parapedobacter sp. SGR-10]|uniref:DUF937 domain-containing protein n=1 Tax=Parapedobacter sp. SGR-10 TaxID=2710879 RepID=UPI0013D81C42|nr:DUF937 domain-containing protein [Parapedobacter sp. SGR-10]NGF56574.1 DUF937 domain-containing protein [Parapedobacter sp. SGR-10]
MNITDLVTGGIGSKAISAIAKTLNIDESKAKWIVAAAVPLMIAALNYNSKKDKAQEESIDQALQNKHNGGILDSLSDFLGQGPSEDGDKIVHHMFGNNTDMVKNSISSKTGISSAQIGTVLATLAPIVMGYLGKQKQTQSSGGGLGDILGGLIGGGSNSSAGGGLLGSVLGSFLGGSSSKAQDSGLGGLSDLAGEFFNKDKGDDQKGSVLDALAGMFAK